jgi:signal transduction histidine kinase
MYRETERLIRLVNDLLVLTRADAGALNLQLHPLDFAALGDLVHQRCDHLELRAAQRQVTLNMVEDLRPGTTGTFSVQADADRLAQVLDNLLDNAIRYATPGSAVTVTLGRTGSEVTCQVADSGPGIPAQHLPLIFERFYRADSGRDRGQGGAGLGLAIVRSLVQAHGGRVTVESVEGQGAIFTIWLPALD